MVWQDSCSNIPDNSPLEQFRQRRPRYDFHQQLSSCSKHASQTGVSMDQLRRGTIVANSKDKAEASFSSEDERYAIALDSLAAHGGLAANSDVQGDQYAYKVDVLQADASHAGAEE